MSKKEYVGFVGRPSGKIGVARLLPGIDLLEGIEKVCNDYGIRYGVVWCDGSLASASFIIPPPGGGAGGRVYEKKDYGILLAATGIICENVDGKKDVHLHLVVNNELSHSVGGHALRGKCIVGDTMDLVIMEIVGGKMLRKLEESTGYVEFAPQAE